MGILLRQLHENVCSKKWKHSPEIWYHFVLSNSFVLHFDQFENGFDHVAEISRFE